MVSQRRNAILPYKKRKFSGISQNFQNHEVPRPNSAELTDSDKSTDSISQEKAIESVKRNLFGSVQSGLFASFRIKKSSKSQISSSEDQSEFQNRNFSSTGSESGFKFKENMLKTWVNLTNETGNDREVPENSAEMETREVLFEKIRPFLPVEKLADARMELLAEIVNAIYESPEESDNYNQEMSD